MPAQTPQKGKSILVERDSVPVAGLRARSIRLNSETVDVTNADSVNQWRQLLAGGGTRSAEISGDGVFTDSAADESVRADFFAAALTEYVVTIPDFGTLTGVFQVTALEYAGQHDGEATYSISLASGGEVVFAALT